MQRPKHRNWASLAWLAWTKAEKLQTFLSLRPDWSSQTRSVSMTVFVHIGVFKDRFSQLKPVHQKRLSFTFFVLRVTRRKSITKQYQNCFSVDWDQYHYFNILLIMDLLKITPNNFYNLDVLCRYCYMNSLGLETVRPQDFNVIF